MKRLMCPAVSVGFYCLYFVLLQGLTQLLPDNILTTGFVLLSVLIIIPFVASRSSAKLIQRINGANCSL